MPCENIFIVHYEHILGDPMSYLGPMSDFLELDIARREVSIETCFVSHC